MLSKFVLGSVCFLAMGAAAVAQVTVTVSSPANNFSGPSPIKLIGSAMTSTPNASMSSIEIYVDGTRVYFNWGASFFAYIWMKTGTHNLVVTATDSTGVTGSKNLTLTSTTNGGTIYNVEDKTGWQNCTTSDCAGGNGTSITWTAANQSSPSKDGSSRQFYIGGTPGYSNAYWYEFVGGSASVTNFTYDFWVYVDKPQTPQAVEFDVNQSFTQKGTPGPRWVFGTECNVSTGVWDVWDGGKGVWNPTRVPCNLANSSGGPTWNHIIWKVYRTGNAVHYTSVTINGTYHSVGVQLGNQPYWTGADIDVDVQLDGNANQDPYSVWVDEMKLSAN